MVATVMRGSRVSDTSIVVFLDRGYHFFGHGLCFGRKYSYQIAFFINQVFLEVPGNFFRLKVFCLTFG